MNFGKYTLYSCYGITANCNAFLVAIGIIFGNEDKHGCELEEFMNEKALRYLALVNDYQQFPAARVKFGLDQGVEVCMFQQSSASTAESMNAAHKGVRDRTAVDPINTLLLLLKLEARR